MCQKAHAAPVATWLTAEADKLEWTRGEAASFRSSAKAARTFCPRCGTPLTLRVDDDVALAIGRASTSPQELPPDRQFGTEASCPMSTSWPACRALTPEDGSSDFLRLDSYQHPDHDTAEWPVEADAMTERNHRRLPVRRGALPGRSAA